MAGVKGQRSGGHNAKTTEQHIIDGTYNSTRHRNRADAADGIIDDIAPKPKGLDPIASKHWDDLEACLHPKCLSSSFLPWRVDCCEWFSLYCRSRESWKRDPADKEARMSTTAAHDRWRRLAEGLGISPVSLARLQFGNQGREDKPVNPLHEMLAGRN